MAIATTQAIATLKSISDYSVRRVITEPKKNKEADDAYEERTWRYGIPHNKDGNIVIPYIAFKKSLVTAAKMEGRKIKGKGNRTYSKSFEAGVLALGELVLPESWETVECLPLFVPSNGKPGGGSRVWKKFCVVPEWSGEVVFHIMDATITQDVFLETLETAGAFVGVGRFRPERGGHNGRFIVEDLKWIEG